MPATTWSPDELDRIDAADELQIATTRRDGTLRGWVPIWVVRVGEEVYVRSWRGRRGSWFRHALGSHRARIRVPGTERDVTVDEPSDGTSGLRAAIDGAYRTKYARHGRTYVDPMVADHAATATLRLIPHRETRTGETND